MKHIKNRGRIAAAVTAVVLVAVLAVNVAFGIVADRQRFLTDLTDEGLYTVDPIYTAMLTETFRNVADKRAGTGDPDVRVEIIFCDDPDVLIANDYQRYIYYTARSLAKSFPDEISVSCVDVAMNPSAVQAYRVNSASKIYPSSVIVSSGTEFRVYSVNSFYYFDSNDYSQKTPIGYCGDKTFTEAIRSVTSAESPVCCLVSNHGETYGEAFIRLLAAAGYRVVNDFDLRRDEIPEDCRLLISSGAREDFYAVFGDTVPDGDDEIDKLSGFLDRRGSFLFFFDPDTPVLKNLEEYLVEWGVVIDRRNGEAFAVTDDDHSLTSDGTTIIGQYETTGLGSSILSDMLSAASPEKVIFPDCGSISRADCYKNAYIDKDEEKDIPEYQFGAYYSNGVSRSAFNFFLAGENAVATADGLTSNIGSNKLMTITMEYRLVPEDQGYTWVTEATYVTACASTAFLSDEVLDSSRYGNTDVLLSTLRTMGRRVSATDNVYRMFHEWDLGTVHAVTDGDKQALTVWLAVLPAVLLLGACVIVMAKRRNKA